MGPRYDSDSRNVLTAIVASLDQVERRIFRQPATTPSSLQCLHHGDLSKLETSLCAGRPRVLIHSIPTSVNAQIILEHIRTGLRVTELAQYRGV